MSEQERKTKRAEPQKKDEATQPNPKTVDKGKKLKEDMDKLLDEIDDVLEENAEEFVRSYVQRGGE